MEYPAGEPRRFFFSIAGIIASPLRKKGGWGHGGGGVVCKEPNIWYCLSRWLKSWFREEDWCLSLKTFGASAKKQGKCNLPYFSHALFSFQKVINGNFLWTLSDFQKQKHSASSSYSPVWKTGSKTVQPAFSEVEESPILIYKGKRYVLHYTLFYIC